MSPPGERLGLPTASRLILRAARQVSLQQRRREISDRDIVEAVAGLVARQRAS